MASYEHGSAIDLMLHPARRQTRRPVEISTREYLMSHGREPRGRGSWAFFFDGNNSVDSAFWHNGTYKEARKAAVAHARANGHERISVGS